MMSKAKRLAYIAEAKRMREAGEKPSEEFRKLAIQVIADEAMEKLLLPENRDFLIALGTSTPKHRAARRR